MRILDQVSGEVSPPVWHGRANSPANHGAMAFEPWPAQDPGPSDGNEPQPSRDPADPSGGPIVRALRWLWREIVMSFAAYAEVMYPSLTDPGDFLEHPPRQIDFRADDAHPAEMTRAIDVSPWSQPLPAEHRASTRSSGGGFWARRRARRALREMLATLEFSDDRR